MKPALGVHDARMPQQVAQAFPGAHVGREFVPGEIAPQDLRPKFEALCGPWIAAGGQVYVSFKPKAADVTRGAWTPWLRQLGEWLAARAGNVKVIIYHEPEDDMSGPVFAAMFNRCRQDIKASWPDATVAYCAMAYHWRKGGKAAVDPAGWQKVVSDEYLVDVYSGVSFAENTILPEHPGFTGWFDAVVRPRLFAGEQVQWGMSERGFQAKNPKVRAVTIRREADWLATLPGAYAGGDPTKRPPMLYLAWNTGGTEGDADWILDSTGEEAMRYLANRLIDAEGQSPDTPGVPVVDDRYQEGYAAGRASRDPEIELARMQGRAAGYAAAYAEMTAFAAAKTSGTT